MCMRTTKQICICSETDIRESFNDAHHESNLKDLSSRAKLMTMFSKQKKKNPKMDFFETSNPDFYLVSPPKPNTQSSILKDKSFHRVTPPNNSRNIQNAPVARVHHTKPEEYFSKKNYESGSTNYQSGTQVIESPLNRRLFLNTLNNSITKKTGPTNNLVLPSTQKKVPRYSSISNVTDNAYNWSSADFRRNRDSQHSEDVQDSEDWIRDGRQNYFSERVVVESDSNSRSKGFHSQKLVLY